MRGDGGAVLRHQHLGARLQELLDALPGVGDLTGPGAGGLEEARGGRPAVAHHAVAVDVQHRHGRAVQRVVVGGVDVSDVRDVRRHRLVVPAVAAEQEAAVRRRGRRAEEELVDARLAVGQPVGEEGEIAREARLRRLGVMGGRIERVVDRHALARPERCVGRHHRIAAAVGQHEVVARDQRAERIRRVVVHALERRRRVHVPERHQVVGAAQRRHLALQQLVEHADAARLDDQVRVARVLQRRRHAVGALARIDHHARVVGIGDVAVLLPPVRVRLVEGDVVPAGVQRPDDAAVVRGGAVPVGGDEAGAEEGDVHGRES